VRQWGWAVRDPSGFSKQCEKSVSQEYRDSLRFTGFDLEAFETVLFSYAGTVATLILLLGIDLILLFSGSFEARILSIMGILTFIIPLGVLYLPKRVCKDQGETYENIFPRRYSRDPELHSHVHETGPQPGARRPFCSPEL